MSIDKEYVSRDGEDQAPAPDPPDPTPDAFGLLAPPLGLEDALLLRTSRVVRVRSRARVARRWAALALVFVAGVACGGLAFRDGVPGVSTPTAPSAPAGPTERERPVDDDRGGEVPLESELTLAVARDPEKLHELVMAAPAPERSTLFRRAGDLLLSRSGDVGAALGCYRRFLDLGSPEEVTESNPNDSWLLDALKRDRG